MTSETRDSYQTRALISLAAFRSNLEAVRSCVGEKVKIMAIVKANAYGHGVERLASEAMAHGAECLGVARVGEGIELRAAGIQAKTLVFEIIPPGSEESALKNNLELTVAGLESAKRLDRAASRLGVTANVHVKVDTGMGRLGVDFRSAPDVIEQVARLPHLEMVGVYSHFATSDNPDTTYAREQLHRFGRVLEALDLKKIHPGIRHMANSGAILTIPESHLDMVRPGIMLYGYLPGRNMKVRQILKPVLSLVSHLAFVKTVEAQTSISYGRRYVTTQRTLIGTIPIGYADGFLRTLAGKVSVIIGGLKLPIVGTICMDHVMVDLGMTKDVQEGDEVILIGSAGNESIDAWDVAELAGTIPYEITSLISRRVPRVFVA